MVTDSDNKYIEKSAVWNILNVGVYRDGYNYPASPYTSLIPGKLPLVAMYPVPQNLLEILDDSEGKFDKEIQQVMSYVYASGCNAVIFENTLSEISSQLDAIQSMSSGSSSTTSLSVLVSSEDLTASIEKSVYIVDSLRANQNVKGWFVMDHPKHWDWGNVLSTDNQSQRYNALTLGYRTATSYCRCSITSPHHAEQVTTFSLPGSSSPEWIGDCKDYREYLQAINLLYKPVLWCYDFFPFIIQDTTSGQLSSVVTLHEEFYSYLSEYRTITRKNGSVFWWRCMVNQYKIVNSLNGKIEYTSPPITLGMLRFMVFSALAYGAQGIIYSYFGLRYPELKGLNQISYLSAPIVAPTISDTVAISINPVLKLISTLNEEIDKCYKIFNTNLFINTTSLFVELFTNEQEKEPTQTSEPLNKVIVDGLGVLIAAITDGMRLFIMVVNQDPFNSQTVQLYLNSRYEYTRTYLIPENKEDKNSCIKQKSVPSTDTIITRTLASGGVLIIEVGT